MRRTCAAVSIWLVACSGYSYAAGSMELTPDAIEALAHPNRLVLYSLEPTFRTKSPDKALDGFTVLGKMPLIGLQADQAARAFRQAMEYRGPKALCFEPRHAISIQSKWHTYDFLLCYTCDTLEVFRDEKLISDVAASGSPSALNALLSANNVPLSTSGPDPRAEAILVARDNANWRQWLAATPSSIRSMDRRDIMGFGPSSVPRGALEALAHQFPEKRVRIAALLEWFGAGAGPWSGFPSYEEEADWLLSGYSTPDILSALVITPLDDRQLEGAARYFAGWNFSQKHPNDLKLLPQKLKAALLEHSLKSSDPDKIERVRAIFGDQLIPPP